MKLAHKLAGPATVSIEVYNGKTRKYEAVQPEQVKVVEV